MSISTPMRRIPRPQRAIDPSLPLPSFLRNQLPPTSCLRAASPYSHLRTTSASFSTTPALSFILGKQDKKTHQAFVRRWQKRLLGDSEPIGAHVDPYDPTSPVRIAPEEQGEELEVIEDGESDSVGLGPVYIEAENWTRLRHVGGEAWIDQLEEGKLARDFEKLTMRTYTPLDTKMADQIEDLTGTMYTLRDENLMMAMAFHDFTGKPYTNWSFGPRTRVRNIDALRTNFHRAVVEIHALKQAGKELDISKLPNQGIYDAPDWIKDVKLTKAVNNDFVLSLPGKLSLETFVEEMERVPEYVSEEKRQAVEDDLFADQEELVVEPPEPQVMDSETPAFKRAALVKQDEEKRFDFMSNRPVPRASPVEPVTRPSEPVKETVILETPVETVVTEAKVESEPVLSKSESVDAESKSLEHSTPAVPEVKWRYVPLTDVDMKFALTKRMTQLTGLYITDPSLNSASSLGDLYHHFCVAAKPETAQVFKYIQVEGSKENHKANKLDGAVTKQKKPRSTIGDLLKLKNVQVYSRKPGKKDQRKKTGLQKVIRRELRAKNLLERYPQSRDAKLEEKQEKLLRRRETSMIEGTRVAPQFGTVIGRNAAYLLKERTNKKKMELMDSRDAHVVDQIVRERNLAPERRVM